MSHTFDPDGVNPPHTREMCQHTEDVPIGDNAWIGSVFTCYEPIFNWGLCRRHFTRFGLFDLELVDA